MRTALFACLMGATIIVSVPQALRADEDHRYYDRDHKDYHQWNEAEERAYRHWIVDERHLRYHDWAHATAVEQRDYWRWRHDHPDWH